MSDCFSYAVAVVAKVPPLFKSHDFGRADLKYHPASAVEGPG